MHYKYEYLYIELWQMSFIKQYEASVLYSVLRASARSFQYYL